MSLLAVGVTIALVMPMGATKVVKRDLIRDDITRESVKGLSHIDIMVSLNDEEPHSIGADHFADFKIGDKVTLTCITEGYPEELVNLSWWEGKKPLHYIRQQAKYARSSTASLEELTVEDSGRTFSCRADDSTQTRTVTLRVDFSSGDDTEDVPVSQLHMIVNHDVAMSGDGLLLYGTGDSLSLVCLMQGSDVKRVSWWEGEKKLESKRGSLRKHASSSTLILQDLDAEYNGCRLSCREDDSTMHRTVELLQNNREWRADLDASPPNQKSRVHIFGSSTETSKEVNTNTIIAIWVGIFAFIAVCFVCVKMCKKQTPVPDSSKSSSLTPDMQRKTKQPKKSPGKGCEYSKLDSTLTSLGTKNRVFIFGRRWSPSVFPAALVGDAVQTHGEKTATDEDYTNPGFVSHV